jgi:O-antigen/teichoic acid export membrane protein
MTSPAFVTAREPGGVVVETARRSLPYFLLYGGATLGIAVGVERVAGFVSASLAARIAGPQTFGAYSVALATAGTIAAYAGAGIGTTANRFSGQYPLGSVGYAKFLRTLTIVAVVSCVLAALLMFAAATPLARWVLHNDSLIPLFRIAAVSSGAMVLLECYRGLLIGQRKIQSLLVIAFISGIAIVLLLPFMARIGAGAMIAAQASVALIVLCCYALFGKRLGIAPTKDAASDGPGIRPIVKFGIVQFGAFAGISIATWGIASLVVRSDPSLAQMGFYAVSNQLRGLAVIAPGLLTQIVYSVLTNESGAEYGGAQHVLLSSTIMTTLLVVLVAGLAMTVLPWILVAAYGRSYAGAELPILLLLATAIIHMSGQAASQRLSIVKLRAIAIINTLWAALLLVFGFLLIPKYGAAGAALGFLAAHAISNILVTISLYRQNDLPKGFLSSATFTFLCTAAMVSVGYARAAKILFNGSATLWTALAWLLALVAIAIIGMKHGCFPEFSFKRKQQAQTVPSLSQT